MTLKNTIARMITQYPMLFQDRVQCLDHLFCVIGNGYKWEKGQLVVPKYLREEEERIKSRKDDRPTDEQMIEMQLQTQTPARTKTFPDYKLSSFTQYMLVSYFRQQRALKNVDQIATAGFHEWVSPNYQFYPICEYSKFLNLPKNVQPDWLAGAEETLALVKKFGCNPEYKIDTKSLVLKYSDKPEEA